MACGRRRGLPAGRSGGLQLKWKLEFGSGVLKPGDLKHGVLKHGGVAHLGGVEHLIRLCRLGH